MKRGRNFQRVTCIIEEFSLDAFKLVTQITTMGIILLNTIKLTINKTLFNLTM